MVDSKAVLLAALRAGPMAERWAGWWVVQMVAKTVGMLVASSAAQKAALLVELLAGKLDW